jgi:hypothetical protein
MRLHLWQQRACFLWVAWGCFFLASGRAQDPQAHILPVQTVIDQVRTMSPAAADTLQNMVKLANQEPPSTDSDEVNGRLNGEVVATLRDLYTQFTKEFAASLVNNGDKQKLFIDTFLTPARNFSSNDIADATNHFDGNISTDIEHFIRRNFITGNLFEKSEEERLKFAAPGEQLQPGYSAKAGSPSAPAGQSDTISLDDPTVRLVNALSPAAAATLQHMQEFERSPADPAAAGTRPSVLADYAKTVTDQLLYSAVEKKTAVMTADGRKGQQLLDSFLKSQGIADTAVADKALKDLPSAGEALGPFYSDPFGKLEGEIGKAVQRIVIAGEK